MSITKHLRAELDLLIERLVLLKEKNQLLIDLHQSDLETHWKELLIRIEEVFARELKPAYVHVSETES